MSNKVRAKGARRPPPASRSPFAKSRRPGAVGDREPIGFAAQRWLIVAAAVAAQILVLTRATDPVNIVKLTVVLLAAIALASVTATRIAAGRALVLPTGFPFVAAAAFGVSAVIATAVAPATGIALWGGYLRNAGLFLYLACLVLFFTTVRVANLGFLRVLALSLAAVGGLLSFYSILQRAGADPIPWQQAYPNPVSTFGNPDFAGAFFAIALPLAVWAALWSGLDGRLRAAAVAVTGLLLAGIVISGAAQGYVGAAAALLVLLLGWLVTRPAELRRRGILTWGGVAVVGLGLLCSGLASIGPLARLGDSGAVSIRRDFWHVAATMFGHHPVFGVGMSMYGDYFRAYRTQGIVDSLGAVSAPDTPHSVPVAMFANGGLLLGVGYLAFVVAVAIALVRGLRRNDGVGVMLTAALGAAWVAFQVESTVSIDVVPLVVLHFVLAGAVVARSQPQMRTISLAGAVDARRRGTRAPGGPPPLAVGIAAIAGLVLAWFAIQPLRADVNAASATKATARGDDQAALHDLEQATSQASWQGVYWLQRSKADGAVGNIPQGLADLRHAIAANPRDVDAVVSLAKVEAALKDYTNAAAYYRAAIRLDPLNPELRTGLSDVESKLTSAGQ